MNIEAATRERDKIQKEFDQRKYATGSIAYDTIKNRLSYLVGWIDCWNCR